MQTSSYVAAVFFYPLFFSAHFRYVLRNTLHARKPNFLPINNAFLPDKKNSFSSVRTKVLFSAVYFVTKQRIV